MISKRSVYLGLGLLLAIPLLAAGAPAAQYQGGGGRGQGGGRGPMSPDDRLKQLTKQFNLTADQQTKIKPILVDEQKKMDDLRNNPSGDRQAMRAQMQQIQKDTNSQIRDQLDDTQKAKFDKMEQQRERRGQYRRGGGQGGPGGPDSDNPNGPPPQN